MLYLVHGFNYYKKNQALSDILDSTLDKDTPHVEYQVNNKASKSDISCIVEEIATFYRQGDLNYDNILYHLEVSDVNTLTTFVEFLGKYMKVKDLILVYPNKLTDAQLGKISTFIYPKYMKVFNCDYVSDLEDIKEFIDDNIKSFNVKFKDKSVRESYFNLLLEHSIFTSNKDGKLSRVNGFTKRSEIVYNQLLLSNLIELSGIYCRSGKKITKDNLNDLIQISFQKRNNVELLNEFFECDNRFEASKFVDTNLALLSISEIKGFLSLLLSNVKNLLLYENGDCDYYKVRTLINSNLKLRDIDSFYIELNSLSLNKLIKPSSCINSFKLLLYKHIL